MTQQAGRPNSYKIIVAVFMANYNSLAVLRLETEEEKMMPLLITKVMDIPDT